MNLGKIPVVEKFETIPKKQKTKNKKQTPKYISVVGRTFDIANNFKNSLYQGCFKRLRFEKYYKW